MIYVVYKIIDGVGYYYGKWEDPVKLAKATFEMSKCGINDIEVVSYSTTDDIKVEIHI